VFLTEFTSLVGTAECFHPASLSKETGRSTHTYRLIVLLKSSRCAVFCVAAATKDRNYAEHRRHCQHPGGGFLVGAGREGRQNDPQSFDKSEL
jgi:hypothetical protein